MFEVEFLDQWALVQTLDFLEAIIWEIGNPEIDEELEIFEVEEMLVAEIKLLNLNLPVVRKIDLL